MLVIFVDRDTSNDTVVVDSQALIAKPAVSVSLNGYHEVEHHNVVNDDRDDDEAFSNDRPEGQRFEDI